MPPYARGNPQALRASFLPPFVRFADSLRPRAQAQLAPRFGCKRATGTFTTRRAPAGGIFLLRKEAALCRRGGNLPPVPVKYKPRSEAVGEGLALPGGEKVNNKNSTANS